jgi:hypothetical protein
MKRRRGVQTRAMANVRDRALVVLSLSLALAASGIGCPSPSADTPAPPDAGAARQAEPSGAPPAAPAGAGAAAIPGRPPHPNMATAAWGQRVLEHHASKAPPAPEGVGGGAVLDALHEMTPGSEARAAELAASWFGSATSARDRAGACALLGVALVLDPTVEGYKERITDAYGLAAYAGTLETSDSLGQAARALVGAAAGAVEQAKRLIEVVATTPKLGTEPRLFLALARRLTGERSDAMIEDLRAALAARPGSVRARANLAEVFLDLGLHAEAIAAATVPPASAGAPRPWLECIRGRALVLDGKVDEGVALLKAHEGKLDEGRRGEALYWLGRSLTSTSAPGAEIEAIVASLGARPGFAKEAAVLEALVAQKAADYKKARALVEPIVRGVPSLPVDADAAWLLVDACAGLGDLACVDRAGGRAVAIDGDEGRLHLARGGAAVFGKAKIDLEATWREAHRASPFDPRLAEKVGEPLLPGGTAAASRVRAARRALARKAPKVVDLALAPVATDKGCRPCRALDAAAASGPDAARKATRALEGEGPALSVGDLMLVINALGAAPLDDAAKALDRLAKDPRAPVQRAVERARGDHKDPDARRRRDAGELVGAPEPTTPVPGLPTPRGPGHAGHDHAGHDHGGSR